MYLFFTMKVLKKITALQNQLQEIRSKGKYIGFVPTMGALHEGHLSLGRNAQKDNDVIVYSIFVNPTQFNNPADLETYPRDIEADLQKLSTIDCHIVFVPDVEEIYPETDTRQFDLNGLDSVMEGKHRPGHFNGVAQVVSRFFEIITPDKAYFGQKDFQQLAVIRYLVKQYFSDSGIEIIGCPIIREKSGLAMSSRNILLTDKQKENASLIYQILNKTIDLSKSHTIEEIKQQVTETVNANPFLEIEYFEIVDSGTLKTIANWNEAESVTGCIAVFTLVLEENSRGVRLIDNIKYR